jgi:hypothetical protein
MTDTTAPITFADIVNLGKKRVDTKTTVEVPELGGSVVLRQMSGAEQDAAVAKGHAADGGFDSHIVAREQIKASLVEPALPADEADEIIDNLPVQAFGQLQALVQANSGLLGVGVEQMVAMFRSAAGAGAADGDGAHVDHAGDALVGVGLGSDDTDAGIEVAGVLPSDAEDAAAGSEAAGEDREPAEEAAGVTA